MGSPLLWLFDDPANEGWVRPSGDMLGEGGAIRTAAALAEPGDIVLVAGKGHETYQEIQGMRTPFDDRMELKEAFAPTT